MTGVLSEQCTAKSRRSGQRCRRRVTGGGVCVMHGGAAPQVKAKRLQRVALAQALAADPRRDPAEVLADVGHSVDFLMRTAREEVRAHRPTAATMARLLEATEQAGRWARITLDAGTAERQARVMEQQAAVLAGVIQRVLDRLELSPVQLDLVPVIVVEELDRMSPKQLDAGSNG